jgi:stress response protein YsnF
MASTVIGFYDTEATARQVVQDLQNKGFAKNQIDFKTGTGSASGIARKLEQAGAPRDEARLYEKGVESGGSLVTVTTDDTEAATAAEVMQTYDPIYVEALDEWMSSNVDTTTMNVSAGRDMSEDTEVAYSDTSRSTIATDTDRREMSIPVVEEQVRVGKREVVRGGVKVRSYVTETPVEEQVRLRDETVHVDRHKVDRPLSSTDGDLFKEQTLELTETAEEAVISKEARVVEEVVVSKDVGERTETVRDTVRRTNIDVQQLGADVTDYSRDANYTNYDADFRRHYDASLFRDQYTYEQSQPAYRYGYMLANNDRYKGRNWNDIENDVRTDWEGSNKGTWQQFKDSIRYAWERARG